MRNHPFSKAREALKKSRFLPSIIILIVVFCFSNAAFAAGLTIVSGKTMKLNGATLYLNCLTLTIAENGTLDLSGGKIQGCGYLQILTGGTLIGSQVSIYYCEMDGDGLSDQIEQAGCTSEFDADTDDDGIKDGDEDKNHNGLVDAGETDPCDPDSDNDGIQDGTELGVTQPVPRPDGTVGPLLGTDTRKFQPDLDPTTKTDPLNADTDGDGVKDGDEDINHNGRVDAGETDPNKADIGAFFIIPNRNGGTAVFYLE